MENNSNPNIQLPPNSIPIRLTKYSKKKREELSASWASNRVNIVSAFFGIGGEVFAYVYIFIIGLILSLGVDFEIDINFQLIVNSLLSIACLGIPVLIMPKILKTNFRTLYPLKYKRKGGTAYLVMFGLGIGFLGNYVTDIFSGYIDFLGEQGFPVTSQVGEAADYSLDPLQITLLLISIALVPAIFEELAFRGVYLQGLRKYIGDSGAIFYSALIFGLLHRNIVQTPSAFIAGLVFGYICVYSGSLIPGMIIHFVNNAISVIYALIDCNVSEEFIGYIETGIFIVVIAGSIFGYTRLCKKKPDFLDLPKVISNRSTLKRILTVIFSPLSILVILYCLFYILLYIFDPVLSIA